MVVGAIFESILSKSAELSYFFMIYSMIYNAGLVSIIYPFAIFGYALMEETRPGKHFWIFMTNYTLAILGLKFLVQLDFWLHLEVDIAIKPITDWVIFGLRTTEGITPLLSYILPEVLILACIMANNYYEILIGLYDVSETDLENITQARDRFLKSFTDHANSGSLTIRKQAKDKKKAVGENNEDIIDGMTYEQRIGVYQFEFAEIKNEVIRGRKEKVKEQEDFMDVK